MKVGIICLLCAFGYLISLLPTRNEMIICYVLFGLSIFIWSQVIKGGN